MSRLNVLYFCEGFNDIRFVVGLSEQCELTMAIPEWELHSSGLAERIRQSGARLTIHEISGRRPAFQLKSFVYLLQNIRKFDVVLSQGMVRGSLNSTIAGRLAGVPVVTYLGISPVEYWRCRRERGQIGRLKSAAGEAFIRVCMNVSGRLATTALAMGLFLKDLAGEYSAHPSVGYYYGVDLNLFKPVEAPQRSALRRRHDLPDDVFLIFFSSRISHEKDPETVLRATAAVRAKGLPAVLLNLGGGYQDFLNVAKDIGIADAQQWVIGRPAVHPMQDLCEYFQAADLVIQSSLAEGCGISPLEALACGTPVVATDVGGMAVQLKGLAQLTPRRDAAAMADAILWVARNRTEALAQAMQGREYVRATWRREKAFADLMTVLQEAVDA
ncbi:MAG: glycosyltransferase family 4 protein [Vicinamibacterales bacterium]|nr:glycosyltransferase family 4 protein [Vicinamibacterales bacterium]